MANKILKNKIDIRINKKDLGWFLITFLIFFMTFAFQIDPSKNFAVYLTFFAIGLLSLIVLCFFDKFISLVKIFFSFIFIFFYCAPLSQYNFGIEFWKLSQIEDKDYLYANFIILISIICFLIGYLVKRDKNDNGCHVFPKISSLGKILFIAIDIAILIYFYSIGGLITFDSSTSDSIISIIRKVLRFFPVGTLILLLQNRFNNKKKNNFTIFLNVLIVCILFFPFAGSISRFFLFGTYLIIASLFVDKVKTKAFLPFLLLIGFMFIFPVFNFFKNNTIHNLAEMNFVSDAFNTVDFDAYQMLIYTIKCTNQAGILYGSNLLTSFLFFIPRSVWHGKLWHTGVIVSRYFNGFFENVSCPYVAEFYIAFGPLGVIVLSVILGIILKIFDNWYKESNYIKKGFSCIILGMLLYTLRGAFLPAFSFLGALLLSYSLAIIFMKISYNFKYLNNNLGVYYGRNH